ncbi:MAG: HNH endonuclease [Candidatus Zambryskibacteria bacterium RIFCSPLOWO2_01_FULL_39_39]|uniref:HNH endonuclease n=1 Tax=Candidatus Zambryskibacteria bacterium RIFCSPLOWO2_01_FULL_39_39 TaxID=1802758 RepID=A0A1G2TW39_9BACT|nr:MAG: HNH endonuclease [Candidatus Zambryskibacteria bacterium RIFCSPHIGHO2_01_FULL_39_63]OHA94532.1 MAG: HNH endonuclease [Candidatus Zambryskibacteria bacterium RIFCSPHIGHO2_02_FULL_39_19]OHA97873.1 MAG: HNH endonuclease [Candidatus Zambryskibacteria bacterium RIFCSPHIGHO2_12_FULL_39_21]OHB01516.1 MAG: HNH endonuclease [Candidatus Zambryskibacteria bacterium RIFCSPLOWO2_01_FULL_39_39]
MSKDKKREESQMEFLMEFYKEHPDMDISHPTIVDWVTKEYTKRTGKVYRDPDRGIRKLYQDGFLVKVGKGIYKYAPDFIKKRILEDFDTKTREEVFKRDNYKCVICGRGVAEGMDIHADHVKPKDRGGKATVENGQTLCSQHNFLKKNLGQTTLGKRYFIRLHKASIKAQDQNLIDFCKEVLDLFDKYGIDTQVTD